MKNLERNKKINMFGCFAILVIISFAGAFFLLDVFRERPQSRSERIAEFFNPLDGSNWKTVDYIKSQINDPNSFEHISTKYIDYDTTINIVTEFTATNKMGGRVRAQCISIIDTLGSLKDASIIQ